MTAGNNTNFHFIVFCFVSMFLFLAATYCITLQDNIRFWDEEHYLILAFNLHGGLYSVDGVTSTAFQPPGYPLFLSLLSGIFPSLPFLRFANFALLSLSVCLANKLMLKYRSPLTAIITVTICLLYPLFFYTAGTFFPQTLETALLIGSIFLVAYPNHQNWAYSLTAGILYGLLILTVPLFLAYYPLFILYPLFFDSFKKISTWKAISYFTLGCLLVLGPWTARNAWTFKDFIPISTNGGINLLLGNSHNTRPTAGVNTDISLYQVTLPALNETERDRFYRKQAIDWMTAHPHDALKLYVMKVINFFNYTNELAIKNENSEFRDLLSFLTFYPLLLLAAARVALWKRYPLSQLEKFLLLLLIASPFIQAIFFTRVRFRVPFDFLMIMMGSSAVALFWDSYAKKGSQTD